jgi:transcriptional regulator GlxA family with amidase domain
MVTRPPQNKPDMPKGHPVEDYIGWLDQLWLQRVGVAAGQKPELSVGILLWPGFPLMSLAGIVESLRHAADFGDQSRPLYCRWSVMGTGARASCGLVVDADAPYTNPTDFDYVAVIGGLLPQLKTAPQRHRDYLRVAAAAKVPVIGICTGVFVLAEEGLLAGHKASIHPFHAQDFRQAFPRVPMSTRDDFIDEGKRITVPGGVSILALMTELVRRHSGAERATKVVHQLSLTERKSMSAFDRGRVKDLPKVEDPRIQRAVVLIEGRKGADITTDQAARAVNLSPRQFTRLFREQLGVTPKRYIVDTRLRYARFLVENSALSMTAIAVETGFADCAHFSTTFRGRFGIAPRALREGARHPTRPGPGSPQR